MNLLMSPIMFMLMRWSRTFCSSSGSEMFSTTKVSSDEAEIGERRLHSTPRSF